GIQDPVHGVVQNSSGELLAGATIRIKGQNTPTAGTDADGSFSILAAPGQILIINMIGYLPKEIAIESQIQLQIILESDFVGVEEVVVLGFGHTQKKIAQACSTASISNKELMQSPLINIIYALAGRLP